MLLDFHEKLQRYAALVINIGVHIQRGQILVITAPIAAAAFVRLVVKHAYGAGAYDVYIEWSDDEITRLKYELAPDSVFHEYPAFRAAGWETFAENNAAFLTITAPNPDLLHGIDPQRIMNSNASKGKALAKFRSYGMSNKVSWSIVTVPSMAWAAKVFPDVVEEHLIDTMWEAIFDVTRINSDDPVEAWKTHLELLRNKTNQLNRKKYRALRYRGPGTDLRIELSPKHIWVSDADNINEKGASFLANIPSEEVWTVPLKQGVNGTVRSTKPLSYEGYLIDDFSLTFENGKIINIQAAQGLEVLIKLISVDEGAAYLGEIALVPHHSPISESGLVFYNSLFDENASNHLAIGNAYSFCLEGGNEMTEAEKAANGVNSSLIHVDFMIGSANMDIDGELADGDLEPVFRHGNWA
ncbi:aminopeptidase [Paenibacillus taichungensis]|uniref:Aminopeptidase n=1 Tax=Paenibacillus taichungensis TaxID=484184 RepID=A0A329QKQ6_9BACL|nr:aminopeptidase [Paenibacillus taichungensis]RAW12873.1 aminopeptidase [Paenibacillus taichungensis]